MEIAALLKERYPQEFLKELQQIAQCPIHNKGAELLTPLREHLEGCFDEGALQLFQGGKFQV